MANRPGRTPSHGNPVAASPTQIAEEHRRLRELLARIETTRELKPLLELLGELHAELEEHFAHEEAAGGLEDVVDDAAPHLLEQVEGLFEEHRYCLRELDRLRELARSTLEGPVAEVIEGVAGLCHTLHEHEAVETELLSSALYDEIGGSG